MSHVGLFMKARSYLFKSSVYPENIVKRHELKAIVHHHKSPLVHAWSDAEGDERVGFLPSSGEGLWQLAKSLGRGAMYRYIAHVGSLLKAEMF